MNIKDLILKFRRVASSGKNENKLWKIISHYLSEETGRLLDAGCGSGQNFTPLLGKGKRQLYLFGIDIFAPDLIQAAKKFAGQNCWFIQADGCLLPFKDETFQTIMSNYVIEHIKNYESYMSEITRVIVPRGICFITTPNLERPINIFRKYVLHKPYELRWQNWRGLPEEDYRGHYQEFTEASLKNLMESHGLEAIAIDGIYPKLSMKGSLIKIAYQAFIYFFWLICIPFKKGTSLDIVMIGKKL